MLNSGQRALLQAKIHLAPELVQAMPLSLVGRLPSSWAGAQALAHLLGGMPQSALHWWSRQETGHLLLGLADLPPTDIYIQAELQVGNRWLTGVSRLSLGQVLEQPVLATAGALLPLDHLLGCRGVADGLWLSSGGGISDTWATVGAQIHELHGLGYGLSAGGRVSPAFYLAEGLATALHDRRRLNTQDPKLDRLLGRTLLSEGFWRKEAD